MSQSLPEQIVARATALGEAIAEYAQSHRTAPLAEHEAAVLGLVRGALPELLAGVLRVGLQGGTPGAETARQACAGCGQTCGVQSWRTRQVQTTCGPVTYERPWFQCRRCQQGWSPFDQRLGVARHQRVSAPLEAWLVHLGTATSFAEGAELLARLTGLAVAAETVRQHTEQVGAVLADREDAVSAQVERTRAAAEPVEAAPGRLVVETDGLMVAYRAPTGELGAAGWPCWRTLWQEVKLGVVAGLLPEAARLTALSYVAAQEPVEAFGPRLLAEAARRGALDIVGWTGGRFGQGLAQLRPVVVLGDGAAWIWGLAEEHFGERTEILDFYHASEHLWTLAHALFGQGTREAFVWANARLHALVTDGVAPVERALQALPRPADPAVANTLRRTRQYVRTHAARMAYPTFRQQGLPIGSGGAEGGGHHVIQHRLKRPGARWSPPGARALITLRCRLASNRPLAA